MEGQRNALDTQNRSDTGVTRRGTVRITDRFVKALEPPETGNRIVWDSETKGLGVRVTQRGVKSFVFAYVINGRPRRPTIGRYPDWAVIAARKRAQELRRSVDSGHDPVQAKEALRRAPTVSELFQRFERDYLPKLAESTQRNATAAIRRYINPKLGREKVQDLRFDHCEGFHRDLSQHAPTQANRVFALLRRGLNLAIRWGWIERNPCKGVELNSENKRERYLSQAENERLTQALDEHPEQDSCDVIRLMRWTGCRKGEALNARWDQFNDDLTVWTSPAWATKQRRMHFRQLPAVATEMLQRRKQQGSEFVFPSRKSGALTEIKNTWATVRRSAGLDGVRLHDLRHTYASIGASQGLSLPIIGAMLGHNSTQTTARYAHLFDDSLRHAAEKIAGAMDIEGHKKTKAGKRGKSRTNQ